MIAARNQRKKGFMASKLKYPVFDVMKANLCNLNDKERKCAFIL
jgi:hypothetical protein